jgi:hypothetical protein
LQFVSSPWAAPSNAKIVYTSSIFEEINHFILFDGLFCSEELFFSLVNPHYLSPVTQSEIQAKFEASSEICLPDFLNRESFAAAAQELHALTHWQLTGPPNRYYKAGKNVSLVTYLPPGFSHKRIVCGSCARAPRADTLAARQTS